MSKREKKDLEKLTRTKLVEEAKKFEGIVGASGMKKEELIEAIRAQRERLAEETGEAASQADTSRATEKKKGPTREELKAALATLKRRRGEALEAGDRVQLKRIRSRYKKTNRALRRGTAAKA